VLNDPRLRNWSEAWQRAEMEAMKLDSLAAEVGGHAILERLDDHPLPDEPFNWTGINEDVAPRVRAVLDLVDRCCEVLLDAEYRTACRRLIARAALRDPKVFLRKGKSATAAAAIVWIIGKANDTFDGPRRTLQPSRVVEFLGAGSSASGRAEPFVRAAGFSTHYWSFHLDAHYLVSARRRTIIAERDNNSTPRLVPCQRCPYAPEKSEPDNVVWLR
jgi:hypothetical protein